MSESKKSFRKVLTSADEYIKLLLSKDEKLNGGKDVCNQEC